MELRRIVRMTFRPDSREDFLAVFKTAKPKIRQFPGCKHLELLQDPDHADVLVTFSLWENAEALEDYRRSELFRSTWAITKTFFADRPQAFSLVNTAF